MQNFALDLTPPPEIVYKSEPGTSDGMNVLGIVIFSATMGTCGHCPQQCPFLELRVPALGMLCPHKGLPPSLSSPQTPPPSSLSLYLFTEVT